MCTNSAALSMSQYFSDLSKEMETGSFRFVSKVVLTNPESNTDGKAVKTTCLYYVREDAALLVGIFLKEIVGETTYTATVEMRIIEAHDEAEELYQLSEAIAHHIGLGPEPTRFDIVKHMTMGPIWNDWKHMWSASWGKYYSAYHFRFGTELASAEDLPLVQDMVFPLKWIYGELRPTLYKKFKQLSRWIIQPDDSPMFWDAFNMRRFDELAITKYLCRYDPNR